MESVLGAPMSEMNPALAAYMKKLEGYSTDKVTLSLADSIWMKDEIAAYVKSDFLQTNKDYYDAEIYSAPFDATTTSDVNNWISDKTQGMIDKMLDESKEPKGIMYLINTLYFSGEWSEQYSETDVYTNNFYLSPENPIAAEFMRSAESTYLSDENTTGFIKPYKGGKLAFAALLPDESLTIEEYVATMSETKWENLFKNKKSCTVFSQLPKFAYDFSFNAGDALCAMGMPTAFDEVKADFSDMATLPDKNVFISFVLQNTHIEVDTNGTKAAAATIVGMDAESSTIMETKTVLLDRPFLYAIIDTETNYPLFLGAVVNPKQS
jgi:serpin B